MKYHKIQTVYKRDPVTKYKTLLEGEYSLPEFEYLAENKWVFTEKVDGTNIRVYFCSGHVTFKGRTDNSQLPAKLVERLNEKFLPMKDQVEIMFGGADVCFYGEGYGAKIQKGGGNYRADQDFVLFDIMIDEWWLMRPDMERIAASLEIDVVPVIGEGTLTEMVDRARLGIESTWGEFEAEGIVARPSVELKARNGDRLITKIKCRDFQ